MAKNKNQSEEKRLWMPIHLWNLNELFTTESISPLSFYEERNFGNPVNRNQETIEDINNLILFDNIVKSSILLSISTTLLDTNCLKEIKSKKKSNFKSFEYSKTIYLKKEHFKVYFNSEDKLNEFLNNAFMLLEVKTTNKYKSDFSVINTIPEKVALYQTQLLSNRNTFQIFFDKAFNQIKGLIYGYFIGSIGALDAKEQNLVSDLSKIKNAIGTIHTDIVLSEEYSGFWIINIRKQIKDCQNSYFQNFGKQSDVLDTLLLRLLEIDNLNKMRCDDLSIQKKPNYKNNFLKDQNSLEKIKQRLYKYENEHNITNLREELEQIKQEEKRKGEQKGKTREFFKIGTVEYDRKREIKQQISRFEENEEYQILKREVTQFEEQLKGYQFGFTQYDTSITEQFSRISEYLHEITKEATKYFLAKNNKSNIFPDLSFEFDINKLADYYFNQTEEYRDFSVVFPSTLSENFSETELQLLSIAVNSVLSKPQGRLGNFSEQNILEIIKDIGKQLPENSDKQTLRDYYEYRIGKNENFTFPENSVIANIIVFFMKLNGHDQINKMLVAKNISNRQVSYLLYGAYLGFANMPKTFTNIIFDSENNELLTYIDNYLHANYINQIL
ncbi:hypothetical protein [Sphingobacterium mizutaii]|uniref:hypothetical protein n=1 Tax=Sphingobacterium mizutaii TaxID=1010 RepID=UPI003D97D503